ncbi:MULTISPECIES: response regulator [Geomonas]|uniref:Response regulator n=2 Tax=Geomonas TaxID=2651583 RepID=A0ABS0YIM1_9BACT|nr:response regulator [Geomonas anaerohicana]QWV92426.1 response regulator [Geomonas oryzisoli]
MITSILIVDNDEITRDLICRLISFRIPNAVIHATSKFESALELCKTLRIDIVITATSMQPTSSNDMLDSIRRIENNPIKIIIMTSSGQKDELDRMSGIENSYIIGKPINIEELITLVNDKIVEVERERLGRSRSGT